MDYKNGNKEIIAAEEAKRREREFVLSGESYDIKKIVTELSEGTKDGNKLFQEWLEHTIDFNLGQYIVGVVETETKPIWDDLEYDEEEQTYYLK